MIVCTVPSGDQYERVKCDATNMDREFDYNENQGLIVMC